MYKVEQANTIISLLNDAGLTKYIETDNNGNEKEEIVYLPQEVFEKKIFGLKGKNVNIEHKENEVIGIVIDVIQNTKGIITYSGDKKPADNLIYGVLLINGNYYNEALNFKAISTEYIGTEVVVKENLTTDKRIPSVIREDGKIDGFQPDKYYTDIEYTGVALTNTPKRTLLKNKVFNSYDKTLDNFTKVLKNQETISKNMEMTPEQIKELIDVTAKTVAKETLNSYQEEMQRKNAEAQKMEEEKQKNSTLEEALKKIALLEEKIAFLESMKQDNSEDDKKDNAEDEMSKPDCDSILKKDKEEELQMSLAKNSYKNAYQKEERKNSNTSTEQDWWKELMITSQK